MKTNRIHLSLGVALGVAAVFAVALPAQEPPRLEERALGVDHAECALFGPQGERIRMAHRKRGQAGDLTLQVAAKLGTARAAVSSLSAPPREMSGTIDRHLFTAMADAGLKPAEKINDYEFARRASLDLTGRVPTYDRLTRFIADGSPDKRAKYVDELLASSQWVDKWTMFLGDLLENVDNNTQVRRYPQGRDAFQGWIKRSLEQNTPWDKFVTAMVTATGSDSFEQGELNWMIGNLVTGGPRTGQDNFDKAAATVANKFLGIAHMDCILCHDGRRHLDTLSVWGKQETRLEAWQLASFFSQVVTRRTALVPGMPVGYYAVTDNARAVDYPLNTTTGNRPERQPIGSISRVAPEYPFAEGGTPKSGETYRQALARLLVADPQFARNIVNRVWREFFVLAIVDPVDQFDPMRQSAADVPEGWALQPSNPELLNDLGAEFASGGFDLKSLMRQIVTSEAYQLSSRYEGEWTPDKANLFARKLVRRLWAEEVADNLVQISGIAQVYTAGRERYEWAMQLPETGNTGGGPAEFLNSFLRGNRVDEDRRGDGSVAQVLNLMNDNFVHNRTRASGTAAQPSLARKLLTKYDAAAQNPNLVEEMFLTVLSRPPSEQETAAAVSLLTQGGTGATARQRAVEDLLWVLFNKVDFIYNY